MTTGGLDLARTVVVAERLRRAAKWRVVCIVARDLDGNCLNVERTDKKGDGGIYNRFFPCGIVESDGLKTNLIYFYLREVRKWRLTM